MLTELPSVHEQDTAAGLSTSPPATSSDAYSAPLSNMFNCGSVKPGSGSGASAIDGGGLRYTRSSPFSSISGAGPISIMFSSTAYPSFLMFIMAHVTTTNTTA